VQTNPHSSLDARANGVVQNMPEFGQPFGCKVGQPMLPVNACRVWQVLQEACRGETLLVLVCRSGDAVGDAFWGINKMLACLFV
jgi:hypothetical protein